MSLSSESDGQGHPHIIFPTSSSTPSVVSLLSSRSLSGRRLGVNVHHHFGYRLHLVWTSTVRGTTRQRRGIECRFPTLSAIDNFCTDLKTLPAISTYICVRWTHYFIYHKSNICFNRYIRPHDEDLLHIPGDVLVKFHEYQGIMQHINAYTIPNHCYCLAQPSPKLIPWYSNFEYSHSEELTYILSLFRLGIMERIILLIYLKRSQRLLQFWQNLCQTFLLCFASIVCYFM
jgi:hypothetical protein